MNGQDKVYRLRPALIQREVKVLLVGAGGNGSQVLPGLARLHQTMLALGHPGGLKVSAVDGDVVSEANVGRQLFYRSDIGLPKSVVLMHRVNQCFGLNWQAYAAQLTMDDTKFIRDFDLVIGCVDTRNARRIIHHALHDAWSPHLWLDLGNEAFTGQVILGEAAGNASDANRMMRLPLVTEFYPDILDPALDASMEKDSGPSCSLAQALQKQAAFVNQLCATHALNLLSNLFRFGELSHSAVFFDAKSGASSPLSIDPATWARFGIVRAAPPQQAALDIAA